MTQSATLELRNVTDQSARMHRIEGGTELCDFATTLRVSLRSTVHFVLDVLVPITEFGHAVINETGVRARFVSNSR